MSITTALKARREQLTDREAGFTLIELLVVVIIIGILAAIAIPVYIGVQNNAKDSAIKSDLTNAKTAYSAYVAEKSVKPPTTADLKNYGFTSGTYAVAANAPTINTSSSADGSNFCISGKSDAGTTYYISTTKAVTALATGCPAATTDW